MAGIITIAGILIALFGMMLAMRVRSGPQSTLASVVIIAGVLLGLAGAAFGRDDGRYANAPLKSWFDGLASKGGGPCCSDADGRALSDVDWQSHGGHYQVRLEGEWVDVPDDTVITEPNRAGRTMVWPVWGDGRPIVRCFLPGPMT